jgi:hypothetical protein
MSRKIRLPFVFMLLILLIGCKGGTMATHDAAPDSGKDLTPDVWEKIAAKKIYLGHQSVGDNIISGIEKLMAGQSNVPVKIRKIETPERLTDPVFAHSNIGGNTDPSSKIDAFAQYMDSGIGNSADIAFFKFCYVDINVNTDVEKVFADYRKTVKALKEKYPNTKIVHVTVPLTTSPRNVKTFIKKMLGKADNNIKRNQFNAMLIKEFGGKDPLFDLAKVESTLPNGKRSAFTASNETYYSLAPEYTDDGGHLNEKGSRTAARELLLFLANL